MDRNELLHDSRHLGVPVGVPIWFPCSRYIRRKPCTYLVSRLTLSPNGLKRASSWPMLPVPSGVSKMIFMPEVHSAQTMHLSCVETNTISERTETSFHLTYITYEYHRVCLKWFLCSRYIQHQQYTYLVSRSTLSPNVPKRVRTWSTSPRSAIRCIQNDFWAYGTFSASHTPILHQIDQNELPFHPHHVRVPSGAP
jgi:hypothetical protein